MNETSECETHGATYTALGHIFHLTVTKSTKHLYSFSKNSLFVDNCQWRRHPHRWKKKNIYKMKYLMHANNSNGTQRPPEMTGSVSFLQTGPAIEAIGKTSSHLTGGWFAWWGRGDDEWRMQRERERGEKKTSDLGESTPPRGSEGTSTRVMGEPVICRTFEHSANSDNNNARAKYFAITRTRRNDNI